MARRKDRLEAIAGEIGGLALGWDLGEPTALDGLVEQVADGLGGPEILVNAAGPYVADIAQMLGEALPVENVFHQKIAFADNLGAIDRRMPFSIDLDGQTIDWIDQAPPFWARRKVCCCGRCGLPLMVSRRETRTIAWAPSISTASMVIPTCWDWIALNASCRAKPIPASPT